MLKRLNEVEKNFYNRLESARLIKKQGHIPFTEHMTIGKLLDRKKTCLVSRNEVNVPEQLAVK